MPWNNPASLTYRAGSLLIPLALATLLGISPGCSNPTSKATSSGPITQKAQVQWPEGVPRRVAVLPMDGNPKITTQTTDLLSTELLKLGFDVIERGRLGAVLQELKLSNSGLIDDTTRRKLGSILGVEAVFIGNITGGDKFYKVQEHLHVKMVNVENGKVIWAADTNDSGMHVTELNSPYVFAVREAARLLKQDMGLN
jgi:hypothetical protein